MYKLSNRFRTFSFSRSVNKDVGSTLLEWTKDKSNPVLNPGPGTAAQGFKPGGMPIAGGFRDPSTAWLSKGLWRVLTSW